MLSKEFGVCVNLLTMINFSYRLFRIITKIFASHQEVLIPINIVIFVEIFFFLSLENVVVNGERH